ncbi:MAG: hypothetical protein ACRDOB_04270 [Streptosporangiaceae bacterium]
MLAISLSTREQRVLYSIEEVLADDDPRLAWLLVTFSQLRAGQALPVHEKVRARSMWATRLPRPIGRYLRVTICFGSICRPCGRLTSASASMSQAGMEG